MSGQKLSLEALMSASGPGLFVTPAAAAPAASKGLAAVTATTPALPVAKSHTSGQSAAPARAYHPVVGRDNDLAAAAAAIGIPQGQTGPWPQQNQNEQVPQGDAKKRKKKRGKKNKGAGPGVGSSAGAETGGVGTEGGDGGFKSPEDRDQATHHKGGKRRGGGGPSNAPMGDSGPSGHDPHHHHQHHHKKRKQWNKGPQEGEGDEADQAPDTNKRRKGNRSRGNESHRVQLSRNDKVALTFYTRDDGQQLARNLDERPELVGLGANAGDDDFDALLTNHMQKTTQEMQQQMEAEVKRLEKFQKEQERLLKENEAKMKREAEKLAAAAAAAAANADSNTNATPTLSSGLTAAGASVSTASASPQDSPAASTAKPQRKFIPRILCIYWARGRCTNENCTFKHDPSIPQRPPSPPAAPKKIDAICKYEKTGSCIRGDACQFSHDLKSVPCYHYFLKGYCQHTAEACRFSHENATEAQLEELREEWNQKKLLNTSHGQQQQPQQQQSELGSALASIPPGSFGTRSNDSFMALGLNYGTTAMTTATTANSPFFTGQPETPLPGNYDMELCAPPSQHNDNSSHPSSTYGGEPSS
ncbi:hypothetical protein BGZ73_008349 [Actinomortierella ambigua]|nr:hypothetical protein BGZ73_008349 [Actinomortierella ambigua]